jgi:DNA-binding response OmpR family regulator
MNIIVIEDEQAIQTMLEHDLSAQNHHVTLVKDGNEGLAMLKKEPFDLAIIGWMLPGMAGIDIIKEVRRANKRLKIVLLTAKDCELDLVSGLDAGANDYIIKPFSNPEFNARINALLRDLNDNNQITKDQILLNKDVIIDLAKREVFYCNQIVDLTKLEYDLLLYLQQHKNRALSRDQIMERIWGYKYDSDNRIIDVYIHSLKKKLNLNKEIKSKRGVGYIFTND